MCGDVLYGVGDVCGVDVVGFCFVDYVYLEGMFVVVLVL